MKPFTRKDIKGIEIQNSWTAMDFLANVALQIEKNVFSKQDEGSCSAKTTNKKLAKKKDSVGVKEQKNKKKDSNSGLGKKRERSCSSESEDESYPELPEEFKNAISEEFNGGKEFTGELKLLAEKTLYNADILKGQSRLLLALSYMKCDDFLTPDERRILDTRIGKHECGFIEVRIIEPSLEPGVVKLRIWNNKYVLNGTWKEIVLRNKLVVGTRVQLWGFRIHEELCFALRKLPESEAEASED